MVYSRNCKTISMYSYLVRVLLDIPHVFEGSRQYSKPPVALIRTLPCSLFPSCAAVWTVAGIPIVVVVSSEFEDVSGCAPTASCQLGELLSRRGSYWLSACHQGSRLAVSSLLELLSARRKDRSVWDSLLGVEDTPDAFTPGVKVSKGSSYSPSLRFLFIGFIFLNPVS